MSLMPRAVALSVPLEMDALGSWGSGAQWGIQWFQWKWGWVGSLCQSSPFQFPFNGILGVHATVTMWQR